MRPSGRLAAINPGVRVRHGKKKGLFVRVQMLSRDGIRTHRNNPVPSLRRLLLLIRLYHLQHRRPERLPSLIPFRQPKPVCSNLSINPSSGYGAQPHHPGRFLNHVRERPGAFDGFTPPDLYHSTELVGSLRGIDAGLCVMKVVVYIHPSWPNVHGVVYIYIYMPR